MTGGAKSAAIGKGVTAVRSNDLLIAVLEVAMTITMPDRPTELTDRKPNMDDVRRGCGSFEYIDVSDAEIVHAIACGAGWALVIGNPGWASYEWVYVKCEGTCYVGPPGYVPRAEEDEEWEHSNAGWGNDAAALLEVLLKAEGGHCSKCGCCVLPEEVEMRCRQCRDRVGD